jgi:hypothetical protein
MAMRNGVSVSSVPFEQRYRPPDPKRRRREVLTRGDRLVCGICGGVLGLFLWTFAYFILITGAMKAAARNPVPAAASAAVGAAAAAPIDPFSRLPAFSWGGTVVVGFAIFGAIVGPDRMIDGFMNVLRVENEVSRAAGRS